MLRIDDGLLTLVAACRRNSPRKGDMKARARTSLNVLVVSAGPVDAAAPVSVTAATAAAVALLALGRASSVVSRSSGATNWSTRRVASSSGRPAACRGGR